MVLRLIPCSPRRANSCCHRHQRIKAHQTRSSLISPPPAWHQQRVSEPHGFAVRSSADHLARWLTAHEVHLALRLPCAPDALASTASRPALVTTRDRPSCRNETAMDMHLIWVRPETKYFCKEGWTGKSPDSPSGKSV